MFVLGLQGSPRRKSNTAFLLSSFMEQARSKGARTVTLEVCRKDIKPCEEYIVCEKKGFCPIDDDMKREVYPLLRRADVVVAASPIFFYNVTSQLKALIDRSQTLWARKYRLKLADPGAAMRRGFLLAVGATRGKNLFEGVHLTAKYFFDAVAAVYDGSLTYWEVEHKGDMAEHPTVGRDVEQAVARVLQPFSGRKRVLFASRQNRCRAQMAAAFARHLTGDRVEALSGGTDPAQSIDPVTAEAMAEAGLDMAFIQPETLDAALFEGRPDLVVAVDDAVDLSAVPDVPVVRWQLSGIPETDLAAVRKVRDDIKARVAALAQG